MEKEVEEDKSFTRLPVKWLRDGMKSNYKEREPCFICGTTEKIELHHIYSVSELWHTWVKQNKILITCDDDVLQNRKQFEEDNAEFLNNDNLYSLCKPHHLKLHQLYGKSYSNYMGDRVRAWLHKQKEKYGGNQQWQQDH
jgi:hypothetical protein